MLSCVSVQSINVLVAGRKMTNETKINYHRTQGFYDPEKGSEIMLRKGINAREGGRDGENEREKYMYIYMQE